MENQATTEKNPPDEKKSIFGSILVGGLGVISAVYLFNPGWGVVELIPDNIPGIGNLDEAAAATMLISCLAYFGLDIGSLFGKAKKHKKDEEDGDIIDV